MPTATLQYRVNGGALHTDSIEVAAADVITLTAASFAGWGTPAARWEIVAYPPGWTAPAGWTLDASSGFYYYLANSGGSGVVPPTITIPATSSKWGKWLFRLTVNGTVVSAIIGVETTSPTLGLHDTAVGEGAQFGDTRQWVGPEQDNKRIIDDAALAAAGAPDQKYLIQAGTVDAGTPTALALEALTTSIDFRSTVVPLKVLRSGVAASDVEALRVRRSVTDNGGNATSSTAEHIAFELPNGAGVATDVANIKVQISSTIGPSANIVLSPMGSGTIAPALTVKGGGIIQLNSSDYAHDGYRLILDASGNLSASLVSFDEVNAALALADAAIDFNGQDLGNVGDLTVTGDLTVSGTTTTVDSTTVSLADRLVVFNSSTGVVPVPVNIAGFVIDRGSADGLTKRDMPGAFWDEASSRFDFALNTAGDQSTIGAFVAVKLKALTVSDFAAGVVHSNGSGVLSSSSIVNADVDAAAAIAGTKIAPNFGSQNVSTTGTLAAGNTTVTGTIAASDAVTITKDANGATSVYGLILQNTTATTGGATEQRAPLMCWRGQGRDTSGGGTNQQVEVVFVPVLTAGAGGSTIEVRPQYQRAAGGLSNFGGYWTTSATGLGGLAFVVGTLIVDTSGNGVRSSANGNGGLKFPGTDTMVTSGGSNRVILGTNSTERHAITSTGGITVSKDTSAIERTQHGTAGVNYVDRTGLAATVTGGAGATTLYTIATVSGSYVKVEVEVTAFEAATPANCREFGKRRPFKNIAGTITNGTANDIHTDDDLGTVWGSPPAVTITSSGTDILIQGTPSASDTRFVIKEVRVFACTTSA